MTARAGHLAVEHRPADVLDMNDGSAPVDVGQLVVRDLVAACAVAIYEGVTAVAGIQVGPAPQPQALAVAEELVDAQGKFPGWEISPVDRAGIPYPTGDRQRAGKGRLVRTAFGVRSKDNGCGLGSGYADHQLFRPPGVTALEPYLVAGLQVQPVHLTDRGERLPF